MKWLGSVWFSILIVEYSPLVEAIQPFVIDVTKQPLNMENFDQIIIKNSTHSPKRKILQKDS